MKFPLAHILCMAFLLRSAVSVLRVEPPRSSIKKETLIQIFKCDLANLKVQFAQLSGWELHRREAQFRKFLYLFALHVRIPQDLDRDKNPQLLKKFEEMIPNIKHLSRPFLDLLIYGRSRFFSKPENGREQCSLPAKGSTDRIATVPTSTLE